MSGLTMSFTKIPLRVRVNVDVSMSLKRFKSIRRGEGVSFWITFRYEKLSTFCFVCGRVGHTESYCEVKYAANGGEEPSKVDGDSVNSTKVAMQDVQGSGRETKPVEEGNLFTNLIPFGIGSDEIGLVGVLRSNHVYEEFGVVGFIGSSASEQLDERKRKRGKMILESVPVCSSDVTNEHFLEAGPRSGA
ncbi:hypothetical protein ACS0TY_029232 [Phlomoides rotata]